MTRERLVVERLAVERLAATEQVATPGPAGTSPATTPPATTPSALGAQGFGTFAPRLFDLHCHLDFAEDPAALANNLAALDIGCLSVTVTPAGYEHAARELGACGNVRVGLGLHPWRVEADEAGEATLERFESQVEGTRFIGEVGLDFGLKHEATREVQVVAFDRIAAACAARGGKVLSIHAVRSASVVLDILERQGALDGNTCIFHWFSGTSDELQRAIKQGCFFSVGERMLATKRGRAYAQAIPLERLLLETDLPPEAGGAGSAGEMDAALRDALGQIETLRGEGAAERIAHTSRRLLG